MLSTLHPDRLDGTATQQFDHVSGDRLTMFSNRSILFLLLFAAGPVSVNSVLIGWTFPAAAAEEAPSVQAGPFSFRFATEQEGRAVLTTPDRFTKAMSPFDRKVRMRTSEDRGEQAFLDFAGDAVQSWSAVDRETVTAAIRKIEPSLKQIQLRETPEVLLICTSGKEESGAAYTRGAAIVLPVGQIGTPKRPRDKLIAHELFHVISRNDPDLRDQLYQKIGFRRTRTISLPDELAALKITNPDGPEINQVIDLRLDQNRIITVAPVLYAKRPFDHRNSLSMFGYLEFRLMEVIPMVGKRYIPNIVDGKPVMHEPNHPDYHRQIGRNTRYIIHPDEIMADNFALLVTESPSVTDKWLVDAVREGMFDGKTSRP